MITGWAVEVNDAWYPKHPTRQVVSVHIFQYFARRAAKRLAEELGLSSDRASPTYWFDPQAKPRARDYRK